MSDDLGKTEKLLVLQFLGVLHTWIQETKKRTEEDFAVLSVQESLVKLLFARVSRPDLYSEPQFTEAGELIFNQPEPSDPADWHDLFAAESDVLANVGVHLNEKDVEKYGDVIDFFTREKRTDPPEENEE